MAALAVVWLGVHRGPALSEESLIQEANRQFAQRADLPSHALAEHPAPAGYPVDGQLRPGLPTRWRWVGDFLGYSAVAYDLVGPDQTQATLYVLRANTTGLPALPATEPESSAATGQCSVSAWQSAGRVYVLIVDGGRSRYQQFLDLPRAPLT